MGFKTTWRRGEIKVLSQKLWVIILVRN